MASSDRASQITAIGETIKPLGGKARGMPLSADEWNIVIDVLGDLLQIDKDQDAEVAGRLEQKFAKADHEHLGQVTLAWLDAELQAQMADPSGGIATRQALATMQQVLTAMQAEVARLTALAEKQQGVIDRSSVDELERARQLKAFDTRFAGVEGLRTSVTALSSSQGALQEGVKAVLDLRASLTGPDGAPIDVTGLANRVNDLDKLRESLTGIDGKPLRLKDVQLDLIKLRDSLPDEAGGTLDSRLAELEAGLVKRFDDAGAANMAALREDVDGRFATGNAALDARLDAARAADRASILEAATGLTGEAETRITAGIDQRLTAERAATQVQVNEGVAAAVAQSLGTLDGRIGQAVDGRLSGVTEALRAELAGSIDGLVREGLGAVENRFTTRLDALDAAIRETQTSVLVGIDSRLAELTPQIEARLGEGLDTRLTGLRAELGTLVAQSVTAGVQDQLPALREVASAAVAEGLSAMDQRIQDVVAQNGAALEQRIGAQFDAKLEQLNIGGRIAAANEQLVTQLRSEIATSAADLQASNTRALSGAMTTLRGEITIGRVNNPVLGGVVLNPLRPGG